MPRGSSPDLTMRHPVPAIFFDRLRHLPTSFFCNSNGLQPSHSVQASYVSVPITRLATPATLSTPRSRTLLPPGRAITAYGPAAATRPTRFLCSPPQPPRPLGLKPQKGSPAPSRSLS